MHKTLHGVITTHKVVTLAFGHEASEMTGETISPDRS
jgi:hypothetical protein